MVRKNRGMYGFLGISWVLIAYNICPPRNNMNIKNSVYFRSKYHSI